MKLNKVQASIVLILLLISLALRVYYCRYILSEDRNRFFTRDGNEYYQGALSIRNDFSYSANPNFWELPGEKKPMVIRGPLTSILGAAALILWNNTISIAIMVILLSMLLCLSIAFSTYRITRNWNAAILALGITSVSPFLIYFSGMYSSDIPFFCLVAAVYSLYVQPNLYSDRVKFALIGITLGLSILCRFVSILLLPAILAAEVAGRRLNRKVGATTILRKIVYVCVFAIAVVAPWTIRNAIVFGEFIPVSANSGFSLYYGNNKHILAAYRKPIGEGRLDEIRKIYDEIPQHWNKMRRLDIVSPKDQDRYWRKLAYHNIRTNSKATIELYLRKIRNCWKPWISPVLGFPLSACVMVMAFTLFIYLFGGIGLILTVIRSPSIGCLGLFCMFVATLQSAIFVENVIYRIPFVDIWLMILTPVGLQWLIGKCKLHFRQKYAT